MLSMWCSIYLRPWVFATTDRALGEIGEFRESVRDTALETAVITHFSQASNRLHTFSRCSGIKWRVLGVECRELLHRNTGDVMGHGDIMKDKRTKLLDRERPKLAPVVERFNFRGTMDLADLPHINVLIACLGVVVPILPTLQIR